MQATEWLGELELDLTEEITPILRRMPIEMLQEMARW